MIKFSGSFKLNEIHTVESPFNKDPKIYIFFKGGLNFGGRTAVKFRENGQCQGDLLLCKSGAVNFERAYQLLPPGTKILVMPQFSYMPDQILGKKKNKGQNLTFL